MPRPARGALDLHEQRPTPSLERDHVRVTERPGGARRPPTLGVKQLPHLTLPADPPRGAHREIPNRRLAAATVLLSTPTLRPSSRSLSSGASNTANSTASCFAVLLSPGAGVALGSELPARILVVRNRVRNRGELRNSRWHPVGVGGEFLALPKDFLTRLGCCGWRGFWRRFNGRSAANSDRPYVVRRQPVRTERDRPLTGVEEPDARVRREQGRVVAGGGHALPEDRVARGRCFDAVRYAVVDVVADLCGDGFAFGFLRGDDDGEAGGASAFDEVREHGRWSCRPGR